MYSTAQIQVDSHSQVAKLDWDLILEPQKKISIMESQVKLLNLWIGSFDFQVEKKNELVG